MATSKQAVDATPMNNLHSPQLYKSISRLSYWCLDVSQPYGPSRPATGIALPLPY
jgi:hypothetical protein